MNLFLNLLKQTETESRTKNIQRIYNGTPVDLEVYKIHSKNGYIISANGEFSPIEFSQNQNNLISSDEAFQKALNHINAEKYAWETNEEINPKPVPELVILSAGLVKEKKAKYAYKSMYLL